MGNRSVLLKALGVALREVGQLAESRRVMDEAVQAAVEYEYKGFCECIWKALTLRWAVQARRRAERGESLHGAREHAACDV
jgi:hypothetical protein